MRSPEIWYRPRLLTGSGEVCPFLCGFDSHPHRQHVVTQDLFIDNLISKIVATFWRFRAPGRGGKAADTDRLPEPADQRLQAYLGCITGRGGLRVRHRSTRVGSTCPGHHGDRVVTAAYTPVTGVVGVQIPRSPPSRVLSSSGRARRWHRRGDGFDSRRIHQRAHMFQGGDGALQASCGRSDSDWVHHSWGSGQAGKAPASQVGNRGFKSRLPYHPPSACSPITAEALARGAR